ncbi:GGDEF domain-containing protein [Deinococcus piscis]|uniref:GGDEF domain-containing protein n=1 Tax=Deinococcus piscis TaxID=394230 RepID=A0ABQ3K3R9_9DEIO|nr:EAL domain-containing protein [Deinococcus piscis]GHG00800.1 GGDEF domain-containing protein [Deinococcus piscis]
MTVPASKLQTGPLWPQVIQDLLGLYAPQASFLGQLGGDYLRITAQSIEPQAQQALDPPGEWLDQGVLDWVSVDGHLLGLLWSPEGVGPEVTQLFDRLLANQQGAASCADFELLLTQLPQPTAWLDIDLRVLETSRSFLALFGLERAAVVGQNIRQLDLPIQVRYLEEAVQGRQPEWPEWETTDPRDPDRSLWLQSTVQPFFTGQQSGLLWSLQDITEEREKGEWLRSLLDGLGVPAAVINLGGEIQQANQALGELSGLEGLTGECLQDLALFSEAGKRTVQGLITLAAEGGAALAHPERRRGQPLTLELRRSATRPDLLVAQLSEGRAAGAVKATAASEDHALLQEVLNQQHIATLLVDRSGVLRLINDQAAQLSGTDAARLLGKNLRRQLELLGINLLSPSGEPFQHDPWTAPLPYSTEMILETPGQGRRPMALNIGPVSSTGQAGESRAVPTDLLMITLRDLSDLKRAQAQATYGAYHDQLTGLYNRAGLRRLLAQPETAQSGTVVVVELEEYAAMTSATEATAIHHLLMQLAASFRSLAATHQGEAARLGDGTFALWLPGLTMKRAQLTTEQVTQSSFRVGKSTTGLSFATGLAETSGQSPDTALGNAEIAAQYARRQGRGQVTPYHDELRVQLAETFRLEQSLRDSVSSGQLKLHYQPTLSLSSGQIAGAEALLRWERISTRLSPHELLELASRLRLLQPLSDWVMREAMQQQRAWNELWPNLRVGINVSLEELRQPSALGALWPLLEQLEQQGSPLPNIEISAASMVDFRQQDAGVLQQLHEAGAALWLDHFGEGVMSLSSLTEFPLTGLKLHPQMISGLERGGRGPDLVAATLDMAGRLNLQVTAVGVETPGQLDTLQRLGCHQAQGYAISPPLGATALNDWLRDHTPGSVPAHTPTLEPGSV